MNTDRLLTLARNLRTLPIDPDRFSMHAWFDTSESDKDGLANEVGGCGTTACACGWATTVPEFRAAGLGLGIPPYALPLDGVGRVSIVYRTPTVTHYDRTAVQRFFGIEFYDAEYLFDPSSYPDYESVAPADVAERIEDLVANGSHPTDED